MSKDRVLRVVTYSRVSTETQDLASQRAELAEYVRNRNWILVDEIEDHGFSGSSKDRPGLKKIDELVFKGKLDAVVICRLDRMFRSVIEMVQTAHHYFDECGVAIISLREQIDLSSSVGKLQFHILSALSEFERSLISDRTRASLNYLKSQGVQLGRPRLHDNKKIVELRKNGMSYRKICKELGAPMGTVSRVIADARLTGEIKVRSQSEES